MKTLLPLLALLAAGCASQGVDTRGDEGEPPKPFTRIETASRWVVPAELEGTDSAIVALVDLDFSKRETEIVYVPASFRPDGNDVRLAVFEEEKRLRTIAQLRDELALRTDGTPIGLVVTTGGKALGAGAEVSPAMQQFLRYFVEQLEKAGAEFAILAPSAVSIVRAPRSAPASEAPRSAPASEAPRSTPASEAPREPQPIRRTLSIRAVDDSDLYDIPNP